MSNYPAKFLPFYLMAALIILFIPAFCAQSELTEIQKQAIVYRQQGWQLQQEGKIDEALSYYQKATVLDPNYVMAYNDTGVIFEAMGYPERAKQMYLKAIEIDPDYPNSYSNLALLYEEEKDYTNAILYWIRRATFGGSQDAWAEVARKRLENIARVYPEAYRDIGERYKENLQQLNLAQPSLSVTPEALPQLDISKLPTYEIELPRTKESPSEVSLFRERVTSGSQMPDNKTRALQHLALAKQSFARGQYVAALKEATVAEYFDSSNAEISAFVYTIRKKLLK
jgi:tetratricopeptide (TPR) repeat protein